MNASCIGIAIVLAVLAFLVSTTVSPHSGPTVRVSRPLLPANIAQTTHRRVRRNAFSGVSSAAGQQVEQFLLKHNREQRANNLNRRGRRS
uniref:Secreted protein n=1 Tax=Rhipicephalus zambeziensis TaxID=60191 RepID=A0A224Y551_9ACAR